MAGASKFVGQRVKRREDPRLITGSAVYVDDIRLPEMRSAVLLRKQGRQEVTLVPDYVGFEVPDVFVVGYGLDYDERYRDLSYIGTLDPRIYE